jgi:hypothetical protein
MILAGLIVEIEPRRVYGPGNSPIDRIPMEIRRFEMPTAIHIQWCDAFSPEKNETETERLVREEREREAARRDPRQTSLLP